MIHKEKAKSETTLPLMFQQEWVKERPSGKTLWL
jgi:hypothetical protein